MKIYTIINEFKNSLNKKKVNEVVKYDGMELYPEWLDAYDIGLAVNHIEDMQIGNMYLIADKGMNQLNGDYKLETIEADKYIFLNSAFIYVKGQDPAGDPVEYTKEELDDLISFGLVFNQK